MKEELTELLESIYGHQDSMLNEIAIDGIMALFKKQSTCNLDEDDDGEFRLGDPVIVQASGARGVVGKNRKGIIGFKFGRFWWPITTPGIVKASKYNREDDL